LQIFGAPILRGSGAGNTRLIVKAPYEQHPFDATLFKPVDGMIIHFNAGMQGTGRLVNLPPSAPAPPDLVPRIAPNIDTAANWPGGFTADMLFAGNFVTNSTPVLEHFSLIYEEHPDNQPLFHNPEDPRLGFGHGIVVHKRAEIRNCAISGFPGDGIRLTGTNGYTQFIDGMRIWGFYKFVNGQLLFNPPNPNNSYNEQTLSLSLIPFWSNILRPVI